VAPRGNDTNDGSKARPFATLQHARDAVRGRIAGGLDSDVTVTIRGGTYRLTEPVVFGPRDGGTEKFRVTYAAHPDENPVFSGGRPIRGWQEGADGVWTARIPDVKSGKWSFRELFINGRRATRARHPNKGWLRVAKVGQDKRTSFQFKPEDLRNYGDLKSIELVFLHDWSITRTPVASIEEATRTLSVPHKIGGPSRWAVMDWFEKQPRYFVENSIEFLDRPGEWSLNAKSGVLTYRPRPGETIDGVEAIAPVAPQLIVVRGDLDGNRPVRNLHFTGLEFEHAAWAPPDGIYWGRQACTYWTLQTEKNARSHEESDPAAVRFDGAEGCSFANGRIEHTGASGIWLGRQCRGCRVVRTRVSDVGGNGVMVGEGKARLVDGAEWWTKAPEQAAVGNQVEDCLVELCGRELYGAVGIWVGLAGKTTVAHNEVRQHPYTGISMGWKWWNPRSLPEPRKTPCRENLVASNHIHHVMQILSDGGGIYTLGLQPGSALRANHIHDVPLNAGRAESNGMFLDQGTGEFVIEGNVIYNIARSPFRFHKGWKNMVRNNVVELDEKTPIVRYNDTRKERIALGSNVTVKPGAPALGEAIADIRRRAGIRTRVSPGQTHRIPVESGP